MSIAVNIEKTVGDFQLNTEFYADIGITAIFGPSGAGKSTLVNLIAGLVKPDSGYIKILNEVIFESQQKINVPANKRGIGFVFQDARLFPHTWRYFGNRLLIVQVGRPIVWFLLNCIKR